MRIFLFLCLLAPIFAIQVEENINNTNEYGPKDLEDLETQIKGLLEGLLECIRHILRTGEPSIDLPVLDEYLLENHTVNLDNFNLKDFAGYLHFKHVRGSGLSKWEEPTINVKAKLLPPSATVDIGMDWTAIDLRETHRFDASVFKHTIIGEGGLDGLLRNLNVKMHVIVSLLPLKIAEATVKIALDFSRLEMINVIFDGEDLSPNVVKFVTGLPDFFKNNEKIINDFIKDHILPIINGAISGYIGKDGKLRSDTPIIGKCL